MIKTQCKTKCLYFLTSRLLLWAYYCPSFSLSLSVYLSEPVNPTLSNNDRTWHARMCVRRLSGGPSRCRTPTFSYADLSSEFRPLDPIQHCALLFLLWCTEKFSCFWARLHLLTFYSIFHISFLCLSRERNSWLQFDQKPQLTLPTTLHTLSWDALFCYPSAHVIWTTWLRRIPCWNPHSNVHRNPLLSWSCSTMKGRN